MSVRPLVVDILHRTEWPLPDDPMPVPDHEFLTDAEAVAQVQAMATLYGPELNECELACVSVKYGSRVYGVTTLARFVAAVQHAIKGGTA